MLRKREPVYQALWAGPCDFDEVLISPVMIQDHMPDNMLKALNKVSEHARLMGSLPNRFAVRPGTYEPLHETHEAAPNSSSPVVITSQPCSATGIVIELGGEEVRGGPARDEEEEDSPNSTTLIVVDVEVHQRNEIEPGSWEH